MTAAVATAPTQPGVDRRLLPAAQRVGLLYGWRHGRRIDWNHPTRFTELVQLRKLTDRSPLQTQMMDKIAAKRLAGTRLGEEWIVPTL